MEDKALMKVSIYNFFYVDNLINVKLYALLKRVKPILSRQICVMPKNGWLSSCL